MSGGGTHAGGAWRRLRGPLLALLLLVALLGAVEGALRLLGIGSPPADVLRLPGQPIPEKAITVWDPDLYYRLRPSTAVFGRYNVNRHGVRGPEYDDAKPPGTLRLLCAGDSSTFGLGVGDDETWPAFTARILGGLLEGSARVEAINFGVPGYSTEQTKRQILRDGLALKPDAVVVCPTAQNDSSWRATGGDAVVLAQNSALKVRLDSWHSARLLGLTSDTQSFAADAIRDPGSAGARPRVTPPEFSANLTAIIDAGRAAGVPTMLIVTDHHPDLEAAVPGLADSEALTVKLAAEHDARSVDSRPDFALYAPYPMFSDRIHFVPLGQQLIARQVVLGLLQEPAMIDVGPRAAFITGWRAAHTDGVVRHAHELNAGDRPPLFVALLEALRQDPTSMSRSWPSSTPAMARAALDDFDPLTGRRTAPHSDWLRERIEQDLAPGAPPLGVRLDDVDPNVQPPDPFHALLGGESGHLSPDAVALARAVAAFDYAIGAAPLPRDKRLAQAIALRKSDDPQAALALLDAVIERNDTCTEAYYERAQCLRRAKRRPESLPDLQRVVELEPDSALGQYVAGMLAFEQGHPEQAEPFFRKAIALDSTMGRARFGLARILIDQGHLDEAEEHLAAAALMITDPVDVKPLLAEIQSRRTAAAAPAGG